MNHENRKMHFTPPYSATGYLNIFLMHSFPCCGTHLFLEVRGVEDNAHEHATDGTGNRDGHDPGEHKKGDSLEVDSLEGAVAETDTNSGTSNAHGGGHGKRVLREEKHGDSSTHLHRRSYVKSVDGQNNQGQLSLPRDGEW